MSDCAPFLALVEESVHGRLDDAGRRLLLEHLMRCRSCAVVHERVDRQRGALAAFAPAPTAPPELREHVRRALAASRRTRWLRPALAAAALALVVMAVLVGAGERFSRPGGLDRLLADAVDDHIRVVLRQRARAAEPDTPEALRVLMARALAFEVPLPPAAGGPFRLTSGRPSYVGGQPVACFYYAGSAGYASLFILPLDRLGPAGSGFGPAPALTDRGAYHTAYWRRAGYAYVLVSEGRRSDFLALGSALAS